MEEPASVYCGSRCAAGTNGRNVIISEPQWAHQREPGRHGRRGFSPSASSLLLVCRAVSGNISHDENQFIAPGQFLAYDGLLPYVDYPYTHMPYAIPFYALSALASDYDLLAGRLLSVLFWFGSILVMVAISRRLSRSPAEERRSHRGNG